MNKKVVIACAVAIPVMAIVARVWSDTKEPLFGVAVILGIYLATVGLEWGLKVTEKPGAPKNAHRILILGERAPNLPVEPETADDQLCLYCGGGAVTQGRCDSCGAASKSKGGR